METLSSIRYKKVLLSRIHPSQYIWCDKMLTHIDTIHICMHSKVLCTILFTISKCAKTKKHTCICISWNLNVNILFACHFVTFWGIRRNRQDFQGTPPIGTHVDENHIQICRPVRNQIYLQIVSGSQID